MSDSEHRHISESGEARRLEIFTGAGRRRRWSPEAKAAIVAESYGGGTTVSCVARRHGLTGPQLFAWRRQLRQAAADTSASPCFAPVVVDRTEMRGDDAACVVVEMAGAVVRVPAAASPSAVRAVLRALRSLS
jgi:transposase